MLKSELYELERSVGAIIDNDGAYPDSSYQKKIAETVDHVLRLCIDLKKKWTHQLLSNARDPIIKRYVQYHQAGIIRLSDKVSEHAMVSDLAAGDQAFLSGHYRQINTGLEDVLDFLRYQFYQFFDLGHRVTAFCRGQLAEALSDHAAGHPNSDDATLDHSLVKAIFTSVDELILKGEFTGITYRQVEQVHCIMRLTTRLRTQRSESATADLVLALYQQNFNSLHFYNWFRENISRQAAMIQSRQEKQNFIAGQLSTFSATFVNSEKSLQPETPSTDLYILEWLQEQTGRSPLKARSPVEQFPLSISVPQFAMFIRICQKTGCFPVENVASITRFFTAHFTTKKQRHISGKSFGRAFYSLDQSTAAVIKGLLQKMLNYLNKTYFP